MSYDDTTSRLSNDPMYAEAVNRVVAQNAERYAVDVRRFALDAALRFTSQGVGIGAIQNHAAILLCAEEFRRWLADGTLPDIDKELKSVAAYSWNIARGLFPETLVAQANLGGAVAE